MQDARASFRQTLSESTQKLDVLAKKLGSCLEKARPYYDARVKAKEVSIPKFFFFLLSFADHHKDSTACLAN